MRSAVETTGRRRRGPRPGTAEPAAPERGPDEPPIRAELFTVEQLARHAATMASWHEVDTRRRGGGNELLARLAENEAALSAAYALITEGVHRGRRITPAAEWFIDNYPLIEEQIRTTRKHLPRSYHRELPRLANASRPGTLRVYDLALEFISHSHGRVDGEGLRAFIAAYQASQPLCLGELWAVPIMLRLALIENLRRVVGGIAAGRRDRERATRWVEEMSEVAAADPGRVVLVLADMIEEGPPLSDPFVAELATRLRGQGPALAFPLSWLEQRLAEQGQTVDHVYQQVIQSQAADQVAMGNSIGSLRFLVAFDWRVFVEAMSVVEQALRGDPAGVYATMDFATRDRYRHAVEAIARSSSQTEQEVAKAAIELARGGDGRTAHVGWWLVADGRATLEADVQLRPTWGLRLRRAVHRTRHLVYGGAIAVLTAALTALLVDLLPLHRGPAAAIGWTIVLAIGASQLAIALVHWAATLIVHPRPLPRLDFSRGIPDQHRTLVAVPTMLTDVEEVEALVAELEVRFLANRDRNLAFALVTDFRDADHEHLADDDELLRRAREGIEALDARYRDHGGFFLFHRRRGWNPVERCWMGWERKRGKLEDLNRALRGDRSRFAVVVGPAEKLEGIRYVIALDSDTELPRDAAHLLAATIAHPLQRPHFDQARGRVTQGYAILQPRVGVSMQSTSRSRFARWFGGEPGIDPYTRAVSDVYQDVFEEGSFVGKGIYDVDAIQQAVAGRLPENRILSHDLLEGAYARAGLVSDVILIEDYPSTHGADVARRHRWTRGDWQIAAWLRRRVPGLDAPDRNPISGLSQWKVLDNLRRSLVPIALFALVAIGWLATGAPAVATVAALAIVVVPGAVSTAAALARRPEDATGRAHARATGRVYLRQLARDLFAIASLPFEGLLSLDAIVRATGRVVITRRRLLEWRTHADARRAAAVGLLRAFAAGWIGPAAAVASLVTLAVVARGALPAAAPLCAAWALAPVASWWLSRPLAAPRLELTGGELDFLHRIARRTWRFFATYVSAEDNWLPPDNFQEEPPRGVAHRTSPTNIGLALTSSLAAHDFGFIAAGELIARTTRTLATIDRMEKYRGHLYNWYETTTLAPLPPTYVSTVDSANLAGNLLVLAAGLDELAVASPARPAIARGLATTLDVLAEVAPDGEVTRAIARVRDALRGEVHSAAEASALCARVIAEAEALVKAIEARGDDEARWWARALVEQAKAQQAELAWVAPSDPALASSRADERAGELRYLATRCRELADLDYDFLYDGDRRLLSIGYSVVNHRLDASSYDLLASEARLASFLAIAQGKLPQEHWWSLGRQLTAVNGRQALLSWSGSMFEYLMPLLIMPTYDGTLLDDTYRAIVDGQIAYGKQRGVPWGVSESGFYKTDAQRNYQYRAFGVPGLGFKRGLADDLVISPYSTAMALMVAPRPATANLERMADDGELGGCGFYEAVDYTPGRMPAGASRVTIRSFMAHHQGMTLLSLAYVLLDRPMQRRFATDPAVRATELLLQERVPHAPTITPHPAEVSTITANAGGEGENDLRVYTTAGTRAPEVHLLSNGTYHLMVTTAGGGYARWRDLAVTRWHEDPTRDAWGMFGYLRDVDSGRCWSVAHQPTLVRAEKYEAIFSAGRAEFRRVDAGLETHVEIAVSPEDDAELRRVSLCNRTRTARTLELTSFAEVVLTQAAADAAHPAFSNLFVQTELVREHHAILATRRPRSGDEKPPWMFHLLVIDGTAVGEPSFETSRLAFVGRCRSPLDPIALYQEKLGDSEGAVLDPIVAARGRLVLAPDETARFHLVTGVADSREAAMRLIEKYRDRHTAERLLELARTHGRVVQRHLDAGNADVQLYERLAGSVLYANPILRAPRSLIARNRGGQAGLWPYAISGDLPVVLVRIADAAHMELVRQMVKAHTYWRLKGLTSDLLIWNEDPSGYRQVVQDEIMASIAAVADAAMLDKPGGIFVRRSEQIAEEDKVLMQTVARVIISDTAGSLADHLDRRPRTEPFAPLVPGADKLALVPLQVRPSPPPDVDAGELTAWNGLGGFAAGGSEYVIRVSRDRPTPAPWVNVIANPWFGTVVSESGGAYTWCENAHSYRLTPWNNDAVCDGSGEAFYLRDDEDGRIWSPALLPAPAPAATYTTRHGFGYSVFEVTAYGIASELTTFVATDAPVKLMVVRLRNQSGRARRLSIVAYFELVLGASRAINRPHVVTEIDARSRGLLARNAYNTEFAPRVAFLDCSQDVRTVTGDRTSFLGRNAAMARPVGLATARLSGVVGAGFDPCMAMQTAIELADGQEREVSFIVGSGRDLADARNLIQRFRGTGPARAALDGVQAYWRRTLGAVTVKTPEPALDVLANGWLLYQVVACRMWARSGFYQSGGAFGFRDQLQDAMALVHAEPTLLREQILRAAAHQFPQGDVQHWWHPPQGRGVRTHISDDYLWLPYALCRYVDTVGDTGVLDVRVGFVEGRAVKEDEESYYDLPARAEESAPLYEHCVRAIKFGLKFGAHRLPLMGSGDWNDGMNLVGHEGKGESVWLAFFLHDVLAQFARLARVHGDATFADVCDGERDRLAAAIAEHAWDGDWYRRAYFDDGTPLGSASNEECQLDSLPQSWAVLTGVGSPERARAGLAAVDHRLVRRDLGLVQLFDPPFDHSALRPGYIKGYVPGVRENGGQYTHAAVWAAMAFAAAGDRERAWELFGMINPVHHGDSARAIAVYQVEPYVIAADVYTNPQHAGRGGWTWYTGSAGWMYRFVVESLLGLRLDVEKLWVSPLVPADWESFDLDYRYRETRYHLHVHNRGRGPRVTVDGTLQPEPCVPLRDDYKDHDVVIELP